MLALDTAAYASPWRLRHPAEKALLSLGLLGCAVSLPPWPGAPIIATVALVTMLGPARVPWKVLLRAARAPLGFIVIGILPLLVSLGGSHWLTWNPAGMVAAAQLAGRATAALLCLLLFAATTPLAEVLPRLTRLGIPPAVTDIAALIYRMLFTLLDSASTVRESQAARLGYRTWASSYRSLAGQGAAVFVRAYDRARRLEEGLALRGYTGDLRVDLTPRKISPWFLLSTGLLLVSVVTLALSSRSIM